jgi:hypothetical protein
MKANFKRDFQAAVGTKLEHGSQFRPPRNPGKWSKLMMRAQSGATGSLPILLSEALRLHHNTCTIGLLLVLNMMHRALQLKTVPTLLMIILLHCSALRQL